MLPPLALKSLPSWSALTRLPTTDLSAHNAILVAAVIAAKFFHTYLFGPLHMGEVSRLTNQITYTAVEFALALLVSRQSPTAWFFIRCTLFLLLKWFHMLCADRIARRASPATFHYKLSLTLLLLHTTDLLLLWRYYRKPYVSMVSMIFAVELAVLYANLCASTVYYLLPINQNPHDRLSQRRKFYLHLCNMTIDLIKLTLYMALSMYMISRYCVPLHLFREAYLTLRFAIQKARALIWHRRVTGQYDISCFEVPTHFDSVICIICRDQVSASDSPVKLPCNHIFHYTCLLDWFQCNCCCPTCRKEVLPKRRLDANEPVDAGID